MAKITMVGPWKKMSREHFTDTLRFVDHNSKILEQDLKNKLGDVEVFITIVDENMKHSYIARLQKDLNTIEKLNSDSLLMKMIEANPEMSQDLAGDANRLKEAMRVIGEISKRRRKAFSKMKADKKK